METKERWKIKMNNQKRLHEKILDLKKENLLLLQQNIDKDKKIEELESKINIEHLKHKTDMTRAVSEMRNMLVRKIDNKINMLDISDRKQLFTENILYELRREI